MPTAAAISGGLAAAGSIGSGLLGFFGSKSAASAQADAIKQAIAAQQQLFGTVQGAVSPFIEAGKGVLPTLSALLTPGNMTNVLSQLPGFQFAQDWGQKAVQNLGTLSGLGGNVLTEGAKYATGLAQQGFQNYINPLLQFAGIGAGGAGTLAGAASGTQSALGSTLPALGAAQGAGIMGQFNALAGGLTGAAGGVGNAFLLSKLLGGGGPAGYYGGAPETNPLLNPATYGNIAGPGIYSGTPT
jgi:hypothetical protein